MITSLLEDIIIEAILLTYQTGRYNGGIHTGFF
jgi:hypothetical protein